MLGGGDLGTAQHSAIEWLGGITLGRDIGTRMEGLPSCTQARSFYVIAKARLQHFSRVH